MKPILLSFVMLLATVASSVAQFSLGAHVNPALPISDFSNKVQTGFGFNIEGRYQVSAAFAISVGIGLEAFEYKGTGSDNLNAPPPIPFPNSPGNTDSDASYDIIPVVFSGVYSLGNNRFQPYMMLGLGMNRVLIKSLYFSSSDFHFGLSPGFGFQYEMNRHFNVDFNAEYQLILASNSGSNFYGFVDYISYVPLNIGVFYTFGQ